MSKTLTIDGTNLLSTYKIFYDGSTWWKTPDKMVDFYEVIGRNGEVSIPQGSYSNVIRSFNCFINKGWNTNYNSFVDWIMSKDGYMRIESSEETDVYTKAILSNHIEPKMWQNNEKGSFVLEFNFMPQKFLKTGETGITISSSQTLSNPTHQNAMPLIEVTGTGTITINTSVLTLATNQTTTIIDCETQNAYEGSINRNGDLTVTNGFPVLKSGNNSVSVSGCTIKLYPRWWRL